MKNSSFLALALGALLAACGGGDAGSGTPAPTVVIDASNQTTVARAAIDGGLALGPAQALEEDRATAQSAGATSSVGALATVGSAVQRAATAGLVPRRTVGIASGARPAAVHSSTVACTFGGSVTTTFDDRDDNGDFSGGDALALVFSQCGDTAGELMDGGMVLSIGSVVVTETEMQLSGSMAFQQVSMTTGDASSGIDGSVAFAMLMTPSSVSLSLTTGADGLTAGIAGPGYADRIVYAPGTGFIITEDSTTSSSSLTLNGSFDATSIGGRVTVATLQPLVQSGTDANPSTGQVMVSGAAGSRLRITALSRTQVRLELDADGDGTFESFTVTTWEALRAA